ncbi:membrane integrity-associated transporter subunit PqiC [Gemmatimonas sp.]|uniref:PqiC family protein n=1 Tax=Gemmatimonas sp. TaxID=1962908 RepID=UPI003983BC7B
MRSSIQTSRLAFPLVAFLLGALLLGGCFKLSRESPPLRQYVLSATARPGAMAGAPAMAPAGGVTSPAARATLTVGLRRMDLASYLSVQYLIVRRGTSELVTSEFHRWGEDVGEGINRVVAAFLAGSPPVRAVDVAPWQPTSRHNFLVQLHVTRFEGVADSAATEGRVHVIAGWDIIRPVDGRVLWRGSTDDRRELWRVGDYTGLVRGLDAALLHVARDISACVAQFPNDSTPPSACVATDSTAGGSR